MNFHSQSATFTRLSFDFFFAKQIITLNKEIISPFFQNEKIYFCQDRGVNFVYITILPRKIRIIVFQSVIKILFKSRNCIKFSRAQFLFLSYHVSLDLYSVSNEILTRDNFFSTWEGCSVYICSRSSDRRWNGWCCQLRSYGRVEG